MFTANQCASALIIFAIAWVLSGCADNAPTAGPANPSIHPGQPALTNTTASACPRVWHLGNTGYSDTNGDGRIDHEVSDTEGRHATDGYGRYKVDTDFDGFYDKEFEQGGVAGEIRWSRPIHELVPMVSRAMIPGPLPNL